MKKEREQKELEPKKLELSDAMVGELAMLYTGLDEAVTRLMEAPALLDTVRETSMEGGLAELRAVYQQCLNWKLINDDPFSD